MDDRISTYSSYKIGDRVTYDGFVDRCYVDFVSALVGFGNWTPDTAFCMDVAVSDGKPKILEVNSINSLFSYLTRKVIDQ